MSAETGHAVIDAPRLQWFARQVFTRSGMPAADAELLAEHLIWADLRGIAWLGVNKIPQYLTRLRTGCTPTDAGLTVVRDSGGFLVLDGNDGFGQVVGYHAMKLVIEKARSAGAAAAVLRNTTSAGALGFFSMLAVEARMIGLAINNSPPLQPAPGGAERVVGNQAFAIASPAGRHGPLLLDMATSAITLARIHDYERRGEPLPAGVALNAHGEPTIDPATALGGMLLPMSGHRGFGLALMWEVFTGVLAGGDHFSTGVAAPDEFDRPQGVSMFLLAVDPAASLPYSDFQERMDELIDNVHRSAPTGERPRLPGERSAQIMARRKAEGIPVPAELLATLSDIGADLGLSL